MPGMRFPDCSKFDINWKSNNYFTICRHDLIVKDFWRCFVSLVKFSYSSKFYVNIIGGSEVMTRQFSLIRDWPEIQKSKIPQPEFWQISADWDELGKPKLAQISQIKCYSMQGLHLLLFTFYCLLSYFSLPPD